MLEHNNLPVHEDSADTAISVVEGLSGVLYSRFAIYITYLLCRYVAVIRRTVNVSIKFRRRLDGNERGMLHDIMTSSVCI